MKPFFLSTIYGGIRLKSTQAVLFMAALLALSAWMGSEFSARAPATVAMDIGMSMMHFLLILIGLLWSQELFAKDIEKRAVHALLALPVSRTDYLLGRFFGVCVLLILTSLVFALVLTGVVALVGLRYLGQVPPSLGLEFWLASLFVFLDAATVIAFTWLITSSSSTPMLPFVIGVAFAWASHTLAPAMSYLQSGSEEANSLSHDLQPILDTITYIIPDLSRLDIRHFALYQLPVDWMELTTATAMAVFYCMLSLGAAALVINRRSFN